MEHFIKVTAGEKTNEIWNAETEPQTVDQCENDRKSKKGV
jgi:hypothetical protein